MTKVDVGSLLTNEDDRRALLLASKCCAEANRFNWYDSHFLRRFEAAKRFLAVVDPERLAEFSESFQRLRTRPDFTVKRIDSVFDSRTFDQIIETVHTLPYVAFEHYESGTFGRSLLRRYPFFTELQATLTARVSELVGEAVSPSYNFLSLYRGVGRCDPHLDEPISKWTLDICIEQSVEWPIFFSQVTDWPSARAEIPSTIEELRAEPDLEFESVVLSPNQGAIFSGSAQWHFREPAAGGRFDYCHLLFFHYLPEGSEPLADPKQWAAHFDIPELDILLAADDLMIAGLKRGTSETQA